MPPENVNEKAGRTVNETSPGDHGESSPTGSTRHDGPHETSDSQSDEGAESEKKYPGWKVSLPVMSSLWVVLFLVALDGTLISTAVPKITSDLHSVEDVGWYSSMYTMMRCAFVLFWSKLYSFYNPNWVLISSTVLFEIGSALCGAAPTSPVLILGRAVAGVGAAGIFTGSLVAVSYLYPLDVQPIAMAVLGVNFRLSSILGPLIGGVITDSLTWRWCFYINLPFGGVGLLVLFLLMKMPLPERARLPLRKQFFELDPLGFITFVPSTITLFLALGWGGTEYAWSSAVIIVLLVLFALLFVAFVIVQSRLQERGTVPPRIAKQRSVASVMWFSVANGGAVTTVAYYLPMWFQAVEASSAKDAGVAVLPNAIATVVGALAVGILTSKIGYYAPFMVSSPIFMAVGAGLLTTFAPGISNTKRIIYQVLYGLGAGGGSSQANIAVQAVLTDEKDAAIGQGLVLFSNLLGSAVFVAVGQNVFSTMLQQKLKEIPGLDVPRVLDAGATGLRSLGLSEDDLRLAILAYNKAITSILFVTVGLSSVQLLGAAGVEWKSIRRKKTKGKGGKEEIAVRDQTRVLDLPPGESDGREKSVTGTPQERGAAQREGS